MLLAFAALIFGLTVCAYRYNNQPSSTDSARETRGAKDTYVAQSPHDESRGDESENDSSEELQEKATREPVILETDIPSASPQTTSKASAANVPRLPIPRFTLSHGDAEDTPSDDEDDDTDDMPPPSFPAANSAQRASGPPLRQTPPRPKPASNGASAGLMLPPPRVAPLRGSAAQTSSAVRIPGTGPLPNRAPPSALSLMPPPYKTTNARNKITLKPGHSPLDWAQLQRTSKNLSGVKGMQRVRPSLLKRCNGRKGTPAWVSYRGRVYNITPYIPFHPGGEGEIKRAAGRDGEKLFMEVHPWVNWENMLGECVVGIMVGENDAAGGGSGGLDGMD